MNKVYTSKNDIFIFIVICMIGASAASFKAAMESGAFLSWLTVLLVVVICVAVFLSLYPTRYIIDGDDLLIRYGFQRKRISISQIIYAAQPQWVGFSCLVARPIGDHLQWKVYRQHSDFAAQQKKFCGRP